MVKLTFQEAQYKINQKFNDIILLKYISYNKIFIICKHGVCKLSLANLLSCDYPSIRSAENKTLFFKNMLKEKFPDYEKIFTIKGEFKRSALPITVDSNGILYNIKPDILLKGALPHIKNCLDKTSHSIFEFNRVHNNRYTYPYFQYCGSSCMIPIYCEEHGEFIQKYYIHQMGSGCPSCAEDNRVGGYTKLDFIKNARGRMCVFYIIRCWNEDEEFYKIGITMRSVKKRYSCNKSMPYNKELIYAYKNTDAGLVYATEKKVLKKFKKHSYRPHINFHGISECFTKDLPIEEIKQYLGNI